MKNPVTIEEFFALPICDAIAFGFDAILKRESPLARIPQKVKIEPIRIADGEPFLWMDAEGVVWNMIQYEGALMRIQSHIQPMGEIKNKQPRQIISWDDLGFGDFGIW